VPDEPDGLSVATTRDAGRTVLVVRGELDFSSAGHLRSELVEATRDGAGPVAVDLSGVTFIDSTGVSLLVESKRRLGESERDLVLRAPSERVRRVLDLSGLAQEFDVE
jgi:anti-anti-sigma factor